MPWLDAIVAGLAAAAIAVALGSLFNILHWGPHASPVDLAVMTLGVGFCIAGSHLGTAAGHNLVGIVLGSLVGGILGLVVRRFAA